MAPALVLDPVDRLLIPESPFPIPPHRRSAILPIAMIVMFVRRTLVLLVVAFTPTIRIPVLTNRPRTRAPMTCVQAGYARIRRRARELPVEAPPTPNAIIRISATVQVLACQTLSPAGHSVEVATTLFATIPIHVTVLAYA